jgi:hypothetical protein
VPGLVGARELPEDAKFGGPGFLRAGLDRRNECENDARDSQTLYAHAMSSLRLISIAFDVARQDDATFGDGQAAQIRGE